MAAHRLGGPLLFRLRFEDFLLFRLGFFGCVVRCIGYILDVIYREFAVAHRPY